MAQVAPPSVVRSKTVPTFGFSPAYSISSAPKPTVALGLGKEATTGQDDKEPLGMYGGVSSKSVSLGHFAD